MTLYLIYYNYDLVSCNIEILLHKYLFYSSLRQKQASMQTSLGYRSTRSQCPIQNCTSRLCASVFVYVRVCLWIYWLFNQQASVITCGEVADDRWHKEVSSGIERKWECEKERMFLTAVRLTLTLTPRHAFAHRVICRAADKWIDRVLSRVKGLSSSTKSQLWPYSLLVLLTESWRCILSRYVSFFSQAEQQDKWSEISWNVSCEILNRISALNNFLHIACRCFAYQLGCCCFLFTHMKFISEGLYQGHRASP